MENTKKKVKNTTKKVVKPPYTTETLITEIKECLSPLLSKEKVFNVWSSDIVEFLKLYGKHRIGTEYFLPTKMDKKFYKSNFKQLKNNSIKLIGKLILSNEINEDEVNSLMFKIKSGLSNMTAYTSGYLESWLYIGNYPKYFDDFETIYDTLIDAEENFDIIYEKRNTVKYKKVDLHNDDTWHIACLEDKLKSIYQKLLKLSKEIFYLDFDYSLYQYSNVLQNFIRELYNELICLSGAFFMGIDSEKDIKSKTKNTIIQCFEKLENQKYIDKKSLHWVFRDWDKTFESKKSTDNDVFYSYQELKATMYNMLNSFR